MKKNADIFKVCVVMFSANLLLFFIKLYIGLRTNSISIYSDSVNNLFDSLSGFMTFISLFILMKDPDASTEATVSKSEQLFSFLMSLAVTFTGAYFAYSSLERLMYPTPVWYTSFYLFAIIGTALAKLLMFVFCRIYTAKTSSPVIRVMAYDSLLDFFITSVTVLTLYISGKGSFAFDAVCGIVISAVIIVSAVKLVMANAKCLINYVGAEEREMLEEILAENGVEAEKISYHNCSDAVFAYVKAKGIGETDFEYIKSLCAERTGIVLNFIF